ncbi:MAG TPA: RNA-directed DNA polymerase [Actinomycetota bacterium]|nr:RNA-directed DNA polymerase [Actinomycetota bacterium]
MALYVEPRSGYRTDAVRLVRRNRSGGGVRVFTRLSRRDAMAWHALAGRVGVCLEGRLDRRVVANRLEHNGSTWRLEEMDRAAARARAIAAVNVGTVLHTDVEDFYASVRPGVLERTLRDAGVEGGDAALAAAMIDAWGRAGVPGLPVGPPGSAVMANAVLMSVDASLGARPFLRWVDDYRVAVASEDDAGAVLLRLDEALGRLGLRRSVAKTVVGRARDLRWPGGEYGSA